MTENRMTSAADEILRKLFAIMGDTSKAVGQSALLAAGVMADKHKLKLENYSSIVIDKNTLKEYDIAFKEVGLKYYHQEVEGEDKLVLMFKGNEKNKDRYEEAIKLIQKGRSMANEFELKDFTEKFGKEDLIKTEPLDVVELDRFRDYANMGEVEYSVYKVPGVKDGFGIIVKSKDEVEFNDLLKKTYGDFLGINGNTERTKVVMQLASVNAANIELNKTEVDFVVVDAMYPDTHLVVLEDTWTQFQGDTVIKESSKDLSIQGHKTEVRDLINVLKTPLIMSKEEYENIDIREDLIRKSGYLNEVSGPETIDKGKHIEDKLNKTKQSPLTQKEKEKIKEGRKVEEKEVQRAKDNVSKGRKKKKTIDRQVER